MSGSFIIKKKNSVVFHVTQNIARQSQTIFYMENLRDFWRFLVHLWQQSWVYDPDNSRRGQRDTVLTILSHCGQILGVCNHFKAQKLCFFPLFYILWGDIMLYFTWKCKSSYPHHGKVPMEAIFVQIFDSIKVICQFYFTR